MLKPCVCIDLVFAGQDIQTSIAAVAAAGIPAFEIWGWRDKDLRALAKFKKVHNLVVANINMDPQVLLLEGDAIPAFLQGVRESIAAAKQLDCERITVHVQEVPWGAGPSWHQSLADPAEVALRRARRDNIVAALKAAAPIAEDEGITLMLEPLNTLVDHDGYFLSCSEHAVDIIQEVDSPAVRLLFDIYHMQISEGNLIGNITSYVELLGHLHIGDVPGRHEPGTGEVNFTNVLSAAKHAGWQGYVGMEYIPLQDPATSVKCVSQMIDEVNHG